MKFLIDGYNLLFFHLTPDENLKKNREEFVFILDEKLKKLNINAIVIFDGFSPINQHVERQYFQALTVVFSPKAQTADEYIIETLSYEKNPHDVTVITADKNLGQLCRNLNANVKTPKSFLKDIEKKQSQNEISFSDEKGTCDDSKANIERLLKLFENRLQESEFDN